MKCPNCKRPANELVSIVHNGRIIEGCETCTQSGLVQGHHDSASYHRKTDYRDHAQDVVQRFEPREYIKARGVQAAMEQGYTKEDIRKFG